MVKKNIIWGQKLLLFHLNSYFLAFKKFLLFSYFFGPCHYEACGCLLPKIAAAWKTRRQGKRKKKQKPNVEYHKILTRFECHFNYLCDSGVTALDLNELINNLFLAVQMLWWAYLRQTWPLLKNGICTFVCLIS